MSSVRTHTRRTPGGGTTTVRRHDRDPNIDQRKRDAFERRVLAERQRAANPAAYTGTKTRTPGERSRRRGPKKTRARKHARKAFRLWRHHKAKAVLFASLAVGEYGAWAACRTSAWAWKRSAKTRRRIRARINQARARGRS